MKILIRTAACCLILLYAAAAARAQGWRGVVPLHSTRADVERLFGLPNPQDGFYDFKNESVEFRYSDGPCVNGWDVPRDTVIDIRVVPKQDLRLSKLPFGVGGFKKVKDEELPGFYSYSSEEKGITVKTADGLVVDIIYSWTKKDSHRLCPR